MTDDVDLSTFPPASKDVLKQLRSDEPLAVREIAERADLNFQTARYAVRKLFDAGHLVREPDPAEPRRYRYRRDGYHRNQ